MSGGGDHIFCSPFDEALAARGTPAVFLYDPEGRLRLDSEWTRDAYARGATADHDLPWGWLWVLARDRDSGYVQLVLVTSPALAHAHPIGGGRLDLRTFETRDEALNVLRGLGRPPIRREDW